MGSSFSGEKNETVTKNTEKKEPDVVCFFSFFYNWRGLTSVVVTGSHTPDNSIILHCPRDNAVTRSSLQTHKVTHKRRASVSNLTLYLLGAQISRDNSHVDLQGVIITDLSRDDLYHEEHLCAYIKCL